MLGPGSTGALLIPEHAVVMRHGGDDIVAAIAVVVASVDEAGLAKLEIGMKFPFSGARVGGRFKPALGCDDVVPTVAVDVTGADAVAVTLRRDDVLYPLLVLDFVPGERGIRVTELRQEFAGFAVVI